MQNDEYCPKHNTWFGSAPCPGCRAENTTERERTSAAYTQYIERGGELSFDEWQRRRRRSK